MKVRFLLGVQKKIDEYLLFWKLIHIFVSKLGEIASRCIWMATRVAKFIDMSQVAGWQGETPPDVYCQSCYCCCLRGGLEDGYIFLPTFYLVMSNKYPIIVM
jgi:hypothetical protein